MYASVFCEIVGVFVGLHKKKIEVAILVEFLLFK